MLYSQIQCPDHSKQVIKMCLSKGCATPILCQVCEMNHEFQHINQQFTLQSFLANPNFKGILSFFQNEQQKSIDSVRAGVEQQEETQRKNLSKVIQKLRDELTKLIDQLEWTCGEAIQKRFNYFMDHVKVLEAAHNLIDSKIIEFRFIHIIREVPELALKDKRDEFKTLLDEIHLFHMIEPKQKSLKYEISMTNMDLMHTQAVYIYEENLNDVIGKIKNVIVGSEQYAQPQIPLQATTAKQSYNVKRYKIHEDWVTAICTLNEKGKIATASSDKEIKIFDLNQSNIISTLTGHTDSVTTLLYHWKTNRLVSGSNDRTMKLWDMETYKCISNLIAHTAPVRGLCSIPDDSNNIASCGVDKKIVVWDIDCKLPGVVVELEGHADVVNAVTAFKFQDKVVLASASSDKTIRIWDYIRRRTLFTIDTEHTKSLLYCAQRLFCGGHQGDIAIYDVESQSCVRTLSGHEGSVNGLTAVNNEEYVVSASWDNHIIIWNWKQDKVLEMFDCQIENKFFDPQHYCHGICYLNDGENFVTCSADSNIRVWSPEKQDQILLRLKTFDGESTIDDNRKDAMTQSNCNTKACNIF